MSYYTIFEQILARGFWFNLGHIVIIIGTFLLGVLAYKRNPHNLNNRSFLGLNVGFISLAATVWASDFLFLPYMVVLMVTRATWTAGFIIAISLFHFVYTFPDQNKERPWFFWPIIVTNIVLGIISVSTPLLIASFKIKNDNMVIRGNNIFIVAVILFILFMSILLCSIVIKKMKRLRGRQRVQLKYFLLGISSFLMFLFLIDLIPLMFGVQEGTRYAAISIIFFVGFTAYAVIKHRLMDIRALAFRSFTYSVTFGLIVSAYVSVAYLITARYQDINAINILTLIGLLALYNPLRRFIENRTDRLFFKGQYNFRELVAKINDTITRNSRNADSLTKKLSEILSSDMKALKVSFYLPDKSAAFKQANTLIKNNKSVVFDEMEDNSKERILISKLGVQVLIGIRTEQNTEAILALGEKKSGDMYSATDLRLLELVAPQMAIALENARLYEQAITDGLTGLYHHRYFHIRLSEELARAQRYELPLSLIMMDLDYFKRINDEHGHQAGDKVLIELSKLIKENVRSCDIVGRYGGDEFVILLPVVGKANKKDYQQTNNQIIERLKKVIEGYEFTEMRLKLKASLGVVVYDGKAKTTPDELIKNADKLLYKAKNSGRNAICIEELKSREVA